MHQDRSVPVLIVGAGPTGLALAAQLRWFDVPFRIVDRAPAAAVESRALAVQARTLECLATLSLAEPLVARGRPVSAVHLHFDERHPAAIDLSDLADDTAFPFVLLVSQAETEGLLASHLRDQGVTIERGTAFTALAETESGLRATLTSRDGSTSTFDCAYVAGCDGAHSVVRRFAGIGFEGAAYPQDFLLGDVEADVGPTVAIDSTSIHGFPGRDSIALFFPLRHPSTWRVIAIPSHSVPRPNDDGTLSTSALRLDELQSIVDDATGGGIHLRDPSWLSRFHLHHRQATAYRAGRLFLCGDAAHIHSPVGAQGMNTGMQDAWNLGWKLALVQRGMADAQLLDTYHEERWPVGHALLQSTDRIFALVSASVSGGGVASWLRRNVIGKAIPLVAQSRRVRAAAFRILSELDVEYRGRALSAGDGGGDRLPGALAQRELIGPHFTLALIGTPDEWAPREVAATGLVERYAPAAAIRRLASLPGVSGPAHIVVRPDGYVGYRSSGTDLAGVAEYFARWLTPATV